MHFKVINSTIHHRKRLRTRKFRIQSVNMNTSQAMSWGHILNIEQSLVTQHYPSFIPNTVVIPITPPSMSKLRPLLFISAHRQVCIGIEYCSRSDIICQTAVFLSSKSHTHRVSSQTQPSLSGRCELKEMVNLKLIH